MDLKKSAKISQNKLFRTDAGFNTLTIKWINSELDRINEQISQFNRIVEEITLNEAENLIDITDKRKRITIYEIELVTQDTLGIFMKFI